MNEETLNKYVLYIQNNSGEYEVVLYYNKHNQKLEIESEILNQDLIKKLNKKAIHREEIDIVKMRNSAFYINLT